MPTTSAPPASSHEIVSTRLFDAPRERVWEVWTDPAHIAQWWGPHGFTNTIQEMDVRPGIRHRRRARAEPRSSRGLSGRAGLTSLGALLSSPRQTHSGEAANRASKSMRGDASIAAQMRSVHRRVRARSNFELAPFASA